MRPDDMCDDIPETAADLAAMEAAAQSDAESRWEDVA